MTRADMSTPSTHPENVSMFRRFSDTLSADPDRCACVVLIAYAVAVVVVAWGGG